MGLNLANVADVDIGMRQRGREDVADKGQALDLQHKQNVQDEENQNVALTKGVRARFAQTQADAEAATKIHNERTAAGLEPQYTPGSPTSGPDDNGPATPGVYRNKMGDFDTPDAARAAIPRMDTQTMWEQHFAPQIGDMYMKAGRPDKALEMNQLLNSQAGQRYLNNYHDAMKTLAVDRDGGLNKLQNLYNTQVPNGRMMRWEDAGGGHVKLTNYDPNTGQSKSRLISDADIGTEAIKALGPEKWAMFMAEQMKAQSHANVDFAKSVALEQVKHDLGDKSEAYKIGLQFQTHIQQAIAAHDLDAMYGKDTRVQLPRIPGDPIILEDKGTIYAVTQKGGNWEKKEISKNEFNPRMYFDAGTTASFANANAPGAQATGTPPPGGFKVPSAQAIATLQSDPSQYQNFDAMFGPGAAAKVIGKKGVTAPAAPATPPAGGVAPPAAAPAPAPAAGVVPPAASPAAAAPATPEDDAGASLDSARLQTKTAQKALDAYGSLKRRSDPAGYQRALAAYQAARANQAKAESGWQSTVGAQPAAQLGVATR